MISFTSWSFSGNVMETVYETITFISKNLYFTNQRVINFTEIIKVGTIFIKTTFIDSNKIKKNKTYVLKHDLYLFFYLAKVTDSC